MKSVFIVAEMGINHNGSIQIAKQLIDIAANAGADAIKTQSFKTDELVSNKAPIAEYQRATVDKKITQSDILKNLELTTEMYLELDAYAKSKNIIFFSTPFDLSSIIELEKLQNPIYKIPSGEITNLPYLMKIAQLKKKTILSTGMSNLEEVKEAILVLQKNGVTDLTILHCNTQYPTPFEDANLNAITTLKNELQLPIGYSDHTSGIEAAIAAVALGCEIIEKHFTINRNMKGPDHQASIEPEELYQLVHSIRNIEKAMGDGIKQITNSEMENIAVVRKSIVASRDIEEGEIFTENNITTKRPGGGLSPMLWFEVLGQKAKKNFKYDDFIEL